MSRTVCVMTNYDSYWLTVFMTDDTIECNTFLWGHGVALQTSQTAAFTR